MEVVKGRRRTVYDVLYGFIQLTPVEWEIMHSPYFQRLRWIKQLGFSFYVFPCAEHSRFSHSLGVMHNAHCILQKLGKTVSDEVLFKEGKIKDPTHLEHQMVRLGAMLHDIGTFPFSHTTEAAYVAHAQSSKAKNLGHQDDHEHLGSYVVKNTYFEGGITAILRKYGIDPQELSYLLKGVGSSTLVNQILHSEIDCDRMDYLLRDAHYTGLHYGTYDREYLLHHFTIGEVAGEQVLAVREKALHAVEDFMMARFSWYSQVIRSPRGAMYDALATHIAKRLLEKGEITTYDEILQKVKTPTEYFCWNDAAFMAYVQRSAMESKDKALQSMAECLLFESGVKVVKLPEFERRVLDSRQPQEMTRVKQKAQAKAAELQDVLRKEGQERDWIILDLPKKDIAFMKGSEVIVKNRGRQNLLMERDPAKVVDASGNVGLLCDQSQSILARLSSEVNYIPHVFCSAGAYETLSAKGYIS